MNLLLPLCGFMLPNGRFGLESPVMPSRDFDLDSSIFQRRHNVKTILYNFYFLPDFPLLINVSAENSFFFFLFIANF